MSKKLIPVLLLSFMNTLGFSILIPVLPFLVERYGGGPVLYGALLSLFSIFQFIGSPILGALSDTYGRKPILLISHAGTFIGWLLFVGALYLPDIRVWTITLPLIGIGLARAVDGITGGNISVANAYASDIVAPKDRAKTFGMMGATFGFGMLVGPVMGGLVSATPLGFGGVGILAAAISLMTLIFMYVWLPESLPASKRSVHVSMGLWKRINVFSRIVHFAQDGQVKTLFLVRVLFSIGFVAYISIFIFHAIRFFHLNEWESAQLMLFTGSFMIFNQLIAVKWFVTRLGESKTFSFGQALMLIALAAISLAHSIIFFIGFYYFLNLAIALSMSTFKALIVQSVSGKKRGEIMGVEESLVALVQAVVPIVAGLIYAAIGIMSFAVFAVLNIAVFAVIYRHSNTFSLKLVPIEE
ncbi:MAG: MFS transporter [Candidatus Moranbacteria bacterium]|nr:MFS transporter [Candidatus Moranbacteria bacterium]